MLDSYLCPVCGREEWCRVESFVYSTADGLRTRALPLAPLWRKLRSAGRTLLFAGPRRLPVKCRSLTPYQLLRRRVLFEVWFPGREEVTLTTAYCVTCGFMAYSPRPSDEDVAAKYAFLKRHEPDIGGQAGYGSGALRADRERADGVYARCLAHLRSGKLRVLDYGGGNGKLLQPFLAAGHSCFLIDYNDQPLPGVTKISDDMSTFPDDGGDTFDLIICSHVLEHVSDIPGLVSFLYRRLDGNGLLYAEVPLEIWAGLRIEADPVTHINFFTKNSFAGLFLLNGFELVESRQEMARYGKASLEVVWALARPGTAQPAAGENDRQARAADGLPADIRPLLYPSRRASLSRIYRMSRWRNT